MTPNPLSLSPRVLYTRALTRATGTFAATFNASFSTEEPPTGMNVAWLKNQDGIVLAYKVLRPTKPFFPPPVHANPFLPRPPSPLPRPPSPQELALPKATSIEPTQFPRGSVDLHACRLFPTEKLCTSESIVRAANSRPRLPSDHHLAHPSNTHPTYCRRRHIAGHPLHKQDRRGHGYRCWHLLHDQLCLHRRLHRPLPLGQGEHRAQEQRLQAGTCTTHAPHICTAHTVTRAAPVAPAAHPDPRCAPTPRLRGHRHPHPPRARST